MPPLTTSKYGLPMANKIILTYRYRVKDKHAKYLSGIAHSVNFVWNYCNDVQKHAVQWNKRWPSGFDLNKLTAGTSKFLGIHAGTINAVGEQYAQSRRQHKRPFLRYRGKKNLGWVPFKGRDLKIQEDGFRFGSIDYSVWLSRPLPEGAKIRDGSCFSQDSRGRWYINLVVESEFIEQNRQESAIGIDLGLKVFATLSNGSIIFSRQPYRKSEERLAKAQRARKKRQIKNINAKIVAQRHDFLHKASTKLANEYSHIVVGNISASKLAKTKMAKSVLDAGWSDFRRMLNYKAIARCGTYIEVNEAYTSQICSSCGSKPESRPRGIADLDKRNWVCSNCGVFHDRDHNAALNILSRGYGHVTP